MAEEQTVNLDFLNDKTANAAFNDSEEIQPGGVPAGTYVAEIAEVGIKESKAGNPMVVWQLTVAQGPYMGRYLPAHRNMLPTPEDEESDKKQKWGRLKGELALCQVSLASLPGLPKALEKLACKFVKVKVSPQKDNPEYSNVNITEYVETLEEEEGEDKPAF